MATTDTANHDKSTSGSWELPAIPLAVCTDSYKTSHFLQYPPGCQRMVAVGSDSQTVVHVPHDAQRSMASFVPATTRTQPTRA